MEVQVLVTLQVDKDVAVNLTEDDLRQTGLIAVQRSLAFSHDNGFSHPHAGFASVGYIDAELVESA